MTQEQANVYYELIADYLANERGLHKEADAVLDLLRDRESRIEELNALKIAIGNELDVAMYEHGVGVVTEPLARLRAKATKEK